MTTLIRHCVCVRVRAILGVCVCVLACVYSSSVGVIDK